jgi:hypothetical protein
VRRLTGDEHLSKEFATTWRTYDLDQQTKALLAYAEKLTKAPSQLEDSDVDNLREAGWDEDAIYEATALISFFNFCHPMTSPPERSRRRHEPARNAGSSMQAGLAPEWGWVAWPRPIFALSSARADRDVVPGVESPA